MVRRACAIVMVVVAAGALVSAQRAGASRAPATRETTTVQCAAELGAGIKTARKFCDVLIGATPSESIAMTIPPHTGTATLRFDLHTRFDLPAANVAAVVAYARHQAMVSVIRSSGEVLDRAVVLGEFRTLENLFDQVAGGGRPGGVKAVAPGKPVESIRVTIPAGVSSIGIVGVKLVVLRRTGEDTFDTPGRPVAIVSNARIEYRPR